MAISGVGMANIGFWNYLPMGISNYGGDLQIYQVPEYASRTPFIGYNSLAQMSFFSNFAGGGGGIQPLNLQFNIQSLCESTMSTVFGNLALQRVNTNNQGASALETRLNSLLATEGISDENKAEVNKLINELKEQQQAMKDLENPNYQNSEIYTESVKITEKLTELSKKVAEVSNKIAAAQTEQTEQSDNSEQTS